MTKDQKQAIAGAAISAIAGLFLGLGSGYAALDSRIRTNEIGIARMSIQLDYITTAVNRLLDAQQIPRPAVPPPQDYEQP